MSKRKNELRKGNRRQYDPNFVASLAQTTKLHVEIHTCVRKLGYGLIYDAYAAAFEVMHRLNKAYHVYRCDFCGLFHVGRATLADGTPVKLTDIIYFNGTTSRPILAYRDSKPVAWAKLGDDGRIRMFHSTEKELSQWQPLRKKIG